MPHAGDDLFVGRCANCGYSELRAPEELEPGSECPECHEPTFGWGEGGER